MSPRKRLNKNKGLPPNLYADRKGGVTYYRYKRPDTGKFFPMGKDKAEAIEAAKHLNSRLMKSNLLSAKVLGSGSISSICDQYAKEMIEDDPELKESTKKMKLYRVNRIKSGLGHLAVSNVETKQIVEFLNTMKADAYRQHRIVLNQIFDYAITQGYIKINPVTPTMARKKGIQKERKRLTQEGFKAIREMAPDWFKVAMDLALILCLGRYEVAAMRFDHEKDGRLYYTRKKVDKYDSGKVSVRITPALREVLTRAKAMPPLNQFVVCWRQGSVSPQTLTKWFTRLARECPLYNDWDHAEIPTFHEIRSLGSHLLETMENREIKDIQQLMAHSTDKQTKVYLDGHGEKWVEAEAGNTTLW